MDDNLKPNPYIFILFTSLCYSDAVDVHDNIDTLEIIKRPLISFE